MRRSDDASRKIVRGVLAAAVLLAPTLPLTAEAGTIVSTQRRVAESGTSICGCPDDFSTASEETSDQVGLFDEAVNGVGSSANQTSTVSGAVISGEGGAGVGFTAQNDAISEMIVEFSVDRTGTYPISGLLHGTMDTLRVSLTDSGGAEIFVRNQVLGNFAQDLTLEVGELYTLEAVVSGFGFGLGFGGGWEVALPIPEPGTALLLGLGLGALAASRQGRV